MNPRYNTSKHQRTPLFTALKEVRSSSLIPFDVPGHKHGSGAKELRNYFGDNLLACDMNSMKPLDYINKPVSVIKEAQELLADAYGAEEAFYLVNGTSQGVQTMIMAACSPGDPIIIPRNVHKSAINGLILSGAFPIYIQPQVDHHLGIADNVLIDDVEIAIRQHPSAKAIFIVNPTYYGATCDLKAIVTLAHTHGLAVLVDEAHGAHFGFHEEFPLSAMAAGADLSAVSLHKTGGSLTQSSALLLNSRRITKERVTAMLNLTRTTSASYILMASLDVARKQLALEGYKQFTKIIELVRYGRTEINKISGLYAFSMERKGQKGVYNVDETKLGVKVSGIGLSGMAVYDLLRDKFNIQVEFGDIHSILAIISLGDTKSSMDELIRALQIIATEHGTKEEIGCHVALTNPKVLVTPRNAFYSKKEAVSLVKSIGRVAGESIMTYPPGIPIVTPGEYINEAIVTYIMALKAENTLLTGPADPQINELRVLVE